MPTRSARDRAAGGSGLIREESTAFSGITGYEQVKVEPPRWPRRWRPGRRTKWALLAAVGLIAAAALIRVSANVIADPWTPVFEDDFAIAAPAGSFPGPAYQSGWTAYDGQTDTSGNGKYSADILSVHDGVLDFHLQTKDGQPLSAAPVPLQNGQWGGQTYGRYQVRFRSDELPGFKIAFLLWPDSDKWSEGEIDFPEVGSLAAGETLWANLYPKGHQATGEADTNTKIGTNVVTVDSGWHTAQIDWMPDKLTFMLDGLVIGTLTEGIPDTPMHWVLQTETAIGLPPPAADVSGHIQVDWVRIYSYST